MCLLSWVTGLAVTGTQRDTSQMSPSGFPWIYSQHLISGPDSLPQPQALCSACLAFLFKHISHFPSRRSPKTHLKMTFGKTMSFLLPVSSLALKTCIQDVWKHDLIFCHCLCLAFHGERMCLFQKSLKNLQNVIFLEDSGIESSLSPPIRLDSLGPIYTIFGLSTKCHILFRQKMYCSDRICIVQTVVQFPISYLLISNNPLCSPCMNLKVSQEVKSTSAHIQSVIFEWLCKIFYWS